MKSVSVALATYNGEAYIRQQLETLAIQTNLPAELVVTDDTSTDKTVEYVKEFARTAPFPVHLHHNNVRLGYRANFMKALSLCRSELIALSDQDDIWHPSKLAMAAEALDNPDTVLFFHAAWLVNRTGERIGTPLVHSLSARNPPLSVHSLFGPFGFSMVIHRSLLQFSDLWDRSVDSYEPQNRMGHDHWLFFLGSVFGEIAYSNQKLVEYRQHGGNTFGANDNLHARMRRRLRWLTNNGSKYARLAHVARIRAEILAEAQPRLTGVSLDRAILGEQACSRLADRLALRARLYGDATLRERVGIVRKLHRLGAYEADNGFGLGREVRVKDITLGILLQRFLIPLSPERANGKPMQIDPR